MNCSSSKKFWRGANLHEKGVDIIRCMSYVKRYTECDFQGKQQSDAEHTFNCLVILRNLNKEHNLWDSQEYNTLYEYLMDHDVPEVIISDIPYFKKKEDNEIDAKEIKICKKYDLKCEHDLSLDLFHWLKFVDMLECVYYTYEQACLGNELKNRDNSLIFECAVNIASTLLKNLKRLQLIDIIIVPVIQKYNSLNLCYVNEKNLH